MDHKELKRVIGGILITPLPLGVPLFLAAGTFDYWQGWLFLLLFTVSSTAYGLYIMKHDPALLERRMRVGPTAEKRPAQQIIMSFVVLFFFLVPVVAGLDFRFGWSEVPTGIVFLGNVLVLFSFFIFHIVCKVNSFASATIELATEQKVVSTGPYGIVRHPMYSGALILMLGMPLALASWWAIPVALGPVPFLIWRIIDEERFLIGHLAGYADYLKTVKYRLIPRIY